MHYGYEGQTIKQIGVPRLTWTTWKEIFSLACDKMQFCYIFKKGKSDRRFIKHYLVQQLSHESLYLDKPADY